MKGQVSTEFLVVISFVLLLFGLSVFIYFLNIQEAGQIADRLEATQLCLQVSSSMNAVAAVGGRTTYTFNLSDFMNNKNYTIRIASNAALVRIDFDSSGVGCSIRTTNITNSSGSTLFILQKNATITGNRGVLVVE